MRRRTRVRVALPCALAALAAVPAAAMAADQTIGLTISATPDPIVAGTGVLIYGQLDSGSPAGQTIRLYHRIAGARHFSLIATTPTDGHGFYEFTRAEGVVMTNRAWYVVGPDGTRSGVVHERVASTATLTESATETTTGQKVLFSGTVAPARPGERVLIQEQSSITGTGWRTIAHGRTNAGGAFSIVHAFRTAGEETLRAFVPNTPRNVSGSSDAVTLAVQQTQNPSFTINSSAPQLTVGQPATISGVLDQNGSTGTPRPGVAIELLAASAGSGFQEQAAGLTGPDGRYTFVVTPLHNTAYRVVKVATPKAATATLFEAVADRIDLSASKSSPAAGEPVTFSGLVTPDHTGHAVFLQVQTPRGGWQNVQGTTLTRGSRYSLAYAFGQPGSYTVRARIFGGPENVGAASDPQTIAVGPAAATAPAQH